MQLGQLGIKFSLSATREDLLKVLSRATTLRHGATDMGSELNTGGWMSIVLESDAFWETLGHWRWIGVISMVSKGFAGVLVTEHPWRYALRQMPQLRKKDLTDVLALPEGQFVNIQSSAANTCGFPTAFPTIGKQRKSCPRTFVGSSALDEALRHHGNMENMTLVRAKRTKMMRRPKGAACDPKPQAQGEGVDTGSEPWLVTLLEAGTQAQGEGVDSGSEPWRVAAGESGNQGTGE